MEKLYNSRAQKDYRQALRRDPTPAEFLLWSHLRGRKILGYKFRRQHGIGPYIVDFYCPAARLVIEVDGNTHYDNLGRIYDHQRTIFLENTYHSVLRFRNDQVLKDTETVLRKIELWLCARHHPLPLLN